MSSTFICTEGVEDAQRSQLLSCPRRETTTSCGEIMYFLSPPQTAAAWQHGRIVTAEVVSFSCFECFFLSSPLPSVSLKFKPLHYFSLRLPFGQTPALSARGKTIKSTDKLKHKKVTNHFEFCNKKKVSADRDSHQHYTKKAENVKQHAKIACGDWRTVTWGYSSSLWPLGGSKGQVNQLDREREKKKIIFCLLHLGNNPGVSHV